MNLFVLQRGQNDNFRLNGRARARADGPEVGAASFATTAIDIIAHFWPRDLSSTTANIVHTGAILKGRRRRRRRVQTNPAIIGPRHAQVSGHFPRAPEQVASAAAFAAKVVIMGQGFLRVVAAAVVVVAQTTQLPTLASQNGHHTGR